MNDSIYLSIQNSPRFKELVSKTGTIRLDSFGDHAWALLRIHPSDCLRAACAGGENQP